MNDFSGTLYPPIEPSNLPEDAQWISGQGVGCWFFVENTLTNKEYRIQRFTPEGEVDCDRLFAQETDDLAFDAELPHAFKHISHCGECTIEQGGTIFTFKYIANS